MLLKIGHKKKKNPTTLLFCLSCDRCHETTNHLTAHNDCHRKQITLDYMDMLPLSLTNTHTHSRTFTLHSESRKLRHNNTHIYESPRYSDRYRSLSGLINFHSNPINIPDNAAFQSSIVKSMKLPINPELTLIQVPPLSQLQPGLVVGQ